MRLICPNCGAQYAVGADVIPAGGRDVQCSNCAHTWFETPGASSDDTPPEPRKSKPIPSAAPSEKADAGKFAGSIDDAFEGDDDPALAPAPKAPAQRRKVDPSVADILREEAARETAQRKSEAPAVESQSDLGLSAPAPKKNARTRAIPVDPETAAAATAANAAASISKAAAAPSGSRRELLPDIEDINSSLRSDSERSDNGDLVAHTTAERERRRFRRGFFLVLVIFALLVALYVQADAIKIAVPDLTGVIDSYVNTVDKGRVWLDTTVRGLLTSASADAD